MKEKSENYWHIGTGTRSKKGKKCYLSFMLLKQCHHFDEQSFFLIKSSNEHVFKPVHGGLAKGCDATGK